MNGIHVDRPQIYLFAMNQKGMGVIDGVVAQLGPHAIAGVIGARDAAVRHDYYDEIKALCLQHGIRFLDRSESAALSAQYAFAIGWRWIIHGCKNLIVLHDSLLPRYRGFAPLATALINGEKEIGVTALFASEEFDRGDIIAQRKIPIKYPIKIQNAIDLLTVLYVELVVEAASAILSSSPLPASAQDESAATYSPWRDEDDYRIDWALDAAAIKRFIDALGYPYKGASSQLDGVLIRIFDAAVEPDVKVEQRVPGKVLFVRDKMPTVICGTGMLKLLDARNDAGTDSILPLRKFRSRFW